MRFVDLGIGAVLLVGAFGAQAQERFQETPKDPIVAYRTDVMKSIASQSAALGAIMQRKVPYEQNIALHAQMISIGAKEALKAFETKEPGGTAKPEIWSNWQDFSDRLNALSAAADNLAKKASAGPVTPQDVMSVLTCKSCHDMYRSKG